MRLHYVFREAFKGLGRNLTMTIALVITTAISLSLIVAGLLVMRMTADTKEIYLEKVEVMVQLNTDLSHNDTTCLSGACAQLKNKLEQQDNVESVTYRNREQSYARFVELFQATDPQLVEETSPDALPAALHVRLKDPTNTQAIEAIAGDPAVDTIVDQGDEVRSATGNLDAIRNATFILALVQLIAAAFLIANMVQLAAYNRSTELSIMRMVGSSRWFSNAPFILEAVLAVLGGGLLAAFGVFVGKQFVLDPSLKNLYSSQLIAPIHTRDIWVYTPIVGLAAIVFAGLAAQVTLRAYVRK